MTKFDIQLRRKKFTKSRFERHKNFQNLMGNYDRSSRKRTRGIMVLVFLLILIIAILLAFFTTIEKPNQESPKDQKSVKTEHVLFENMNNETAYKL